jgi:hypothetical protein
MIYYFTVDEDETAESLTVRAALPAASNTKGEAIVWILGNEGSVITSGLAVRPQSIMLGPGDFKVFKAYTVPDGGISVDEGGEVTWTVTGASFDTVFDGNTLKVGAGETARTFTVTATKGSNFGTAIVTVLGNEDDPAPVSGGIYLSPQRDVVRKGRTTVFKAYSDPNTEIPTGSLTWTVFGSNNSGTVVNNGTLTAAEDEAAERLTVRARTVDGHYGTAVVTVTTADTINSVENVSSYLGNTNGGWDSNNPLPLPLYINLPQDWLALLAAIAAAQKYVSLDLSDCLMEGATFDPVSSISYGKDYIASLVLPDAATSIRVGGVDTSTTVPSGTPSLLYFTAIKSIEGKNVTSISNAAFYNLTSLTSINFPSAASIGDYAFCNCTAIKSVNLPSATTIGDYAFYKCTGIESAALPLATTIGSYAFYQCTGMSPVSITSATEIKDYAFYQCTALASVNLLETETIGNYAFSGCDNLKTATLPKATTIGEHAFEDCIKLTSVVDMLVATNIKTYAFYGCTKLTSVSLPATLNTIGDNVFGLCTSLTSLSVAPASNMFSVQDGRMLFRYNGTLVSYPTATGAVTLDDSIRTIASTAFYKCTALTSVNAPGVVRIGGNVFYQCTNLTSATLTGATVIGENAFQSCTNLTSANFPNAGGIGENAFQSCTNLISATLTNAGNIGNSAFSGCSALTSADLTKATSIGTYAFYNCKKLESVALTQAVSIGDRAFYGCIALASADLTKATSIGSEAFYNCKVLASSGGLTLASATSIGNSAFYGCSALTSVSASNVTSIGNLAFYNCTNLTLANFLNAESIGANAFQICNALTSADLPSATSIGIWAFHNCNALETVKLTSATSLGNNAFQGCAKLINLYLPSTPPTLCTGVFLSTKDDSGGTTLMIRLPASNNVTAYTGSGGWGVSANTAAEGNEVKYGNDHKAINIVYP